VCFAVGLVTGCDQSLASSEKEVAGMGKARRRVDQGGLTESKLNKSLS